LTITGLQFTGAAVLKRSNAAYEMTSLAAARDRGYSVVDQLADASMIGRKPSNADIAATRHLIQAMQRAGVTPPHSGAKLTAAQMDAVLAGQQTISERMAIRMLVHQAGIEPMAAR
jgi:hypothetical protein